MHLALVINSLGIGGAERVLIHLANYWADKGHTISLIVFFQAKNSYQVITNNNIRLINLDENYLLQKNSGNIKYFFNIINRIFNLRQKIKLLQPDIIVSFLVGANICVLLANIYSKIPVIVSERADPLMHNISTFYKKLRLLTYKYAAVITVQNNNIAQYFLGKFKNKVFIIPNSVTLPTMKKNSEIVVIKKIISVGRLDLQKDHKTLIYAFAKIAAIYPDVTLTIYGDGELREFLQNLLAELKLTDKVLLPGIVNNIQEKLIEADLFVFPSIAEGFSNALCEAMSYGLPVIAADCTGNVNIIENEVNGLLFKCGDIEELAFLMQKLLNNSEYCNKLASNAKNIVHRFAESEILKLWDDVLEFSRASK